MRFAVEFSVESARDFELIFDHLFESYVGFGESPDDAAERAARRIVDIRKAAERLGTFPIRGTARDDVLPGLRYLAIDRAIYWFDVDHAARRVPVLAAFFGGQDHVRRMLIRLLSDDDSG
jgi:toxin ParE1/3/4